MKTKFKSILALAILMMCMSSCVYSLFPIYTKDTLVYLPELVGKWQLGNDPSQYVTFKAPLKLEGTVSMTSTDTVVLDNGSKVVLSQSMTMGLGGDAYIVVGGDTIRDRRDLKALYDEKMGKTDGKVAEALDRMLTDMGEAADALNRDPANGVFDSDDMAYRMTFVNGEDIYKYEVHLAQIGEDIFMDLYATEDSFSDKAFGSNVWFPVHTFMKLELDNEQLTITQFDLDKMNDLFDSNLIRMSHETMDGTVLITAQPEEIQKFLKKYSRDESVFDEVEVYSRIVE